MSVRGLVHNDTFIFDGTNYDIWKIRMLNHFRAMDPNMERIVDIGFSPPMDSLNLSCEDEKNLYLNAQASNVLVNALSSFDTFSIKPFQSAHELWTKPHDKYVCPILLRMILLLPLPAVMSSHLHLLHQCVERHKVMIW